MVAFPKRVKKYESTGSERRRKGTREMTRGKINSRGMVVDYACGFAEYVAGVLAPDELADQSDLMHRNCDFNQYEVDRITYTQGLPEIHRDSGALMKISEMSVTYAKPQRENQLTRLLGYDF